MILKKDRKRCSVCGTLARWEHYGKRYCTRNECQAVAMKVRRREES